MICDRCGNDTNYHTLSYFNEDDICLSCEEKEVAHPDYEKAKAAEEKAQADFVRRGKPMNFCGIGLPADLEVTCASN